MNHNEEITKFKRLEKKLQKFEKKLLSEIKWELNNLFEETLQDIKNNELTNREFGYFFQIQNENTSIWNNRLQMKQLMSNNNNDEDNDDENIKKKLRYRLPDKIFLPRESYLTHLLKVPHMKCVYNLFVVMLSILTVHTFVQDYLNDGRINLGIETIQASYGGFHKGLLIWSCMNLTAFGLFYAFKLWDMIRFSLRKNKKLQTLWNYSCSVIFVIFQLSFAYCVSISTVRLKISFVTSTAVLLEMVRIMMKMHAFIRTNAPIQASDHKYKTNDDDDGDYQQQKKSSKTTIMKFSKYLYFLFAPTLIYRNEYPRTKIIRWKFVMARLSEIIAINFLQAYLYERYLTPYYKNFGKDLIKYGDLIQIIFGTMMPGIIIFLSGFYVILHSTQNAMAEILYFADRMFYKDWWTAKSFSNYYRTWNIIVHDWLYEYIYKDCYMYLFKGSKTASIVIVFFSSAFVHEYIIAVLLRFIFPFMFLLFMIFSVTVMLLLKNVNNDWGNLMLWFLFVTGNGLIVSFYSMEYFARQNCPVGDKWFDYVIPVSWSCNGIIKN